MATIATIWLLFLTAFVLVVVVAGLRNPKKTSLTD